MEPNSNASRQPRLSFLRARYSAGKMDCLSTCCRSSVAITAVNNLYPVFRHVMGLNCSGFPTHPTPAWELGLFSPSQTKREASNLSSALPERFPTESRLPDGKPSTRKRKGHPFREPSSSRYSSELTSKLQGRVHPRLKWESSDPLPTTHAQQDLPENGYLGPQAHHSNTQ